MRVSWWAAAVILVMAPVGAEQAPRFGFKAVDPGASFDSRVPATRPPATAAGPLPPPAAGPLTPNDVPHAQRRGSGVERLPDTQTFGRTPAVRNYGNLSGSSGAPRGVRPVPGRR